MIASHRDDRHHHPKQIPLTSIHGRKKHVSSYMQHNQGFGWGKSVLLASVKLAEQQVLLLGTEDCSEALPGSLCASCRAVRKERQASRERSVQSKAQRRVWISKLIPNGNRFFRSFWILETVLSAVRDL